MIKLIFNKGEQNLLKDALNKDEYLDELKQIRNHMRSIMNSWRDAEYEDQKDYACYYVYEKNLCGDLDEFIRAMERKEEEYIPTKYYLEYNCGYREEVDMNEAFEHVIDCGDNLIPDVDNHCVYVKAEGECPECREED